MKQKQQSIKFIITRTIFWFKAAIIHTFISGINEIPMCNVKGATHVDNATHSPAAFKPLLAHCLDFTSYLAAEVPNIFLR